MCPIAFAEADFIDLVRPDGLTFTYNNRIPAEIDVFGRMDTFAEFCQQVSDVLEPPSQRAGKEQHKHTEHVVDVESDSSGSQAFADISESESEDSGQTAATENSDISVDLSGWEVK